MATLVPSAEAILAGEELAYLGHEAGHTGRDEPLPGELDPTVVSSLVRLGITRLHAHQGQMFRLAAQGAHVLVATGTASGKTLAFNLPVVSALTTEPSHRALYVYPTKALARDQARALTALGLRSLRPAIYDGDTERERRRHVRRWANLLMTNPDMLHVGILPHHDRWADVLANLRYVVVDEAHVYRGVFGSHVANVLRRLRRLAALYGARPQFLLASATIANPGQLGTRLVGEQVEVVDDDGAARVDRTVALWNPVLVDPELGRRASALGEGARLLALLVERGLRTICFVKSRKAAELVHRFACERVGPDLAARLSPYRAGYTADQRREIERRLVEGELLGVTATDALELGIDVGSLDCAVSVGFPGTVASLRQQWGRAGRREAGLAVLVASEDALDQFFMREPRALLDRRVEAAILDHQNPRVLDGHVHAAAFEAPIREDDRAFLGAAAVARAATLASGGELRATATGYAWAGRDYPAARVSLRTASERSVNIVDEASGTVLGAVEIERAPAALHDGAVYLHLGQAYLVQALDLRGGVALVDEFGGDYYTQTKRETAIAVEDAARVERRLGVDLHFGRVSVSEQVVAYERRSITTQQRLGLEPLQLPPAVFVTEALWFSPTRDLLDGLEELPRLLGSLHAAEHALIALLPLWAMCDRWDIGGLSTNVHADTGEPTIFVYDGHPGGVGIAERGFERFEEWAADTRAILHGCPCEEGCPSCVQSPKCGNLNELLDKCGARALLDRLLEHA